jgi:hypothetical protein
MDEKKKPVEGEKDLKKKDCPLSSTDWVMFLSAEINTRWMELLIGVIALVSFIIVLLSDMIALTGDARKILLILIILAFLCIVVVCFLIKVILGHLAAIRGDILTGKSKDSHKILERYLDAVGEGSKFFSGWCTLGSLCIAIGFALMGILFSLRYIDSSEFIFAVIFNFLLIFAGSLMISGAYHAGTDVNKYPGKPGIKTVKNLWDKNKLLFFGILFLFCDLFVLIVL